MYKLTVFVPDINYQYSCFDDIAECIRGKIDFAKVFLDGVVNIDWDDDIDINYTTATRSNYEAYYKESEE